MEDQFCRIDELIGPHVFDNNMCMTIIFESLRTMELGISCVLKLDAHVKETLFDRSALVECDVESI